MKTRLLPIFLAGLLCGACGSSGSGSGAPPTSGAATSASGTAQASPTSAPAGASRLVYKEANAVKDHVRIEVTGTALARKLNDGRFVIYVYSSDIDPKPTCQDLKPAERNAGKGAEIGLVFYDFANKPGKVKAKEALIDYHKPTGEALGIDDLHGPDVDIQSIDEHKLTATVVTPDPPSEDVPRVDGTLVAEVCAPQK